MNEAISKMIGTHEELYHYSQAYGFPYSDGNKEDFMDLIEMYISSGNKIAPKSREMYNQFLEDLELAS